MKDRDEMSNSRKAAVVEGKFTSSQVARAVGVDSRRLEGWMERDILRPKGESKQGVPMEYSFGDAMVAAVLAELQRLLGSDFRPGRVASLVEEALDPRSLNLLGLLAAPAGSRARPEGGRVFTAHLVIRNVHGEPEAEILYHLDVSQMPSAILVDLGRLGTDLLKCLEAEMARA